jgi:hypothetical protein
MSFEPGPKQTLQSLVTFDRSQLLTSFQYGFFLISDGYRPFKTATDFAVENFLQHYCKIRDAMLLQIISWILQRQN